MGPGLKCKDVARQMEDVKNIETCRSVSALHIKIFDQSCSNQSAWIHHGTLRSLQFQCRVARGFEMRCRPLCDVCVEAPRELVCMVPVPSEDISDALRYRSRMLLHSETLSALISGMLIESDRVDMRRWRVFMSRLSTAPQPHR